MSGFDPAHMGFIAGVIVVLESDLSLPQAAEELQLSPRGLGWGGGVQPQISAI